MVSGSNVLTYDVARRIEVRFQGAEESVKNLNYNILGNTYRYYRKILFWT